MGNLQKSLCGEDEVKYNIDMLVSGLPDSGTSTFQKVLRFTEGKSDLFDLETLKAYMHLNCHSLTGQVVRNCLTLYKEDISNKKTLKILEEINSNYPNYLIEKIEDFLPNSSISLFFDKLNYLTIWKEEAMLKALKNKKFPFFPEINEQ